MSNGEFCPPLRAGIHTDRPFLASNMRLMRPFSQVSGGALVVSESSPKLWILWKTQVGSMWNLWTTRPARCWPVQPVLESGALSEAVDNSLVILENDRSSSYFALLSSCHAQETVRSAARLGPDLKASSSGVVQQHEHRQGPLRFSTVLGTHMREGARSSWAFADRGCQLSALHPQLWKGLWTTLKRALRTGWPSVLFFKRRWWRRSLTGSSHTRFKSMDCG